AFWRAVAGRLPLVVDRGIIGYRLIGELDHPARLFARVIFLKAGTLETARNAIGNAGDLEFLLRNAHRDRPIPPAAAFGVFGVKVVEAGRERTFDQRLAARRFDMPPALGDPACLCAITDADADEVLGGIADAKIGQRRRGESKPETEPADEQRRPAGKRPPCTAAAGASQFQSSR